MALERYSEEVNKCYECNVCLEVCPTHIITKDDKYTPVSRLKIAKKILNNQPIEEWMVKSAFFCTQCMACKNVCPVGIEIPNIIGAIRFEMFKRGLAPLPPHKKVLDSILKHGNSVGGDPEKRWEWLPEEYNKKFASDSSTLFFIGCLSAYMTKDVATSSIKILDKAGVDFRLIKDEGCCGAPFLNFGDWENAEKTVKTNLEKFDKLGIKEILVACAGCYKMFKEYYPKIAGGEVKVYHIIEVLNKLYKEGKLKIKNLGKKVIYHDPCHLGRLFNIYDEPRNLLNASSKLIEMDKNREESFCCGANSGVRAAFRDLSVQMALTRVREAKAKAEVLTTSCPFCLFNLNYASIKSGENIPVKYLAEIILEGVE